MSISLTTAFADGAWLLAGTLLGVGAMALRQKFLAWREARAAAEWDPY